MNRRGFLKAIFLTPVAIYVAPKLEQFLNVVGPEPLIANEISFLTGIGLLKQLYGSPLVDLFFQENPFMRFVEKDSSIGSLMPAPVVYGKKTP